MKIALIFIFGFISSTFAKDEVLEKVEFKVKVWKGDTETEYKGKDLNILLSKPLELTELGISCQFVKNVIGIMPHRAAVLTSNCTLKDGVKFFTEVTCPIDSASPYIGLVPFNFMSKDEKQRLALMLSCKV